MPCLSEKQGTSSFQSAVIWMEIDLVQECPALISWHKPSHHETLSLLGYLYKFLWYQLVPFFKLLFIFHYYSVELENWLYFTFLAETQMEEISTAPGTLQATPEKKSLDQVRHKADSDSISSRSALHSPECDSLKMNLSLRCSLGTSELEHLNHSWSGGELLITRRSHEIHVCHQARHRLRWVCCLLFWTFY